MGRDFIAAWAWTTAACLGLAGCDARVDEGYRGEPLLSLTGSLVLENGSVPPDLVPALAFPGQDSLQIHFLDVDTRGEFPANFSLDVMLPPPTAAMHEVAGLPSYAVGWIAAIHADHAATLQVVETEGSGEFTWCEQPDNAKCFRRTDVCEKGSDNCYHQLLGCKLVDVQHNGVQIPVCDEVLEESGDHRLANYWDNFPGLSLDYYVLYTASAAPAGSRLPYMLDGVFGSKVGEAFRNTPITAGYHLLRAQPLTDQEFAALEACQGQAEVMGLNAFNAAHATNYKSFNELSMGVVADNMLDATGWVDHPWVKEFDQRVITATYEAGCKFEPLHLELLDPSAAPVVVTLGRHGAGINW